MNMTEHDKDKKENMKDLISQDKYVPNRLDLPEISEKDKEQLDDKRKELEKFKKRILKKYKFIFSVGIIPPQASEKIEEEEDVPVEEAKKKPMHLLVLIPEEEFKNIRKIQAELVKDAQDLKQNIWIHLKTPVDVWNYCLDGKYDIIDALAMSFPLYDKGFLSSLRVASIHKSLVLRKFERYVTSYVIGGSLVTGTAIKTSDVDVFVVIDDTDVKRMPRVELKEKLRSIIYSYIMEASQLAGVKNKLNVQVYLLTEFWESVKDAHPVMFTFIRDGVPLYDRGTFMPWKLLLKMGKIKPSPEAIDMFMSMGDKLEDNVKRRIMDLLVLDIYWGVLTPAQALMMLYGLPPPTPKETPKLFRETFVKKEKILEKRYADILEEIVQMYKDYEHEKLKEISGKDVDRLLKNSVEFMKRLKELRKKIEEQSIERTLKQVYEDVFKILKGLFGKKSEEQLVKKFEKELVNKGKSEPKFLGVLNDLRKVKKKKKLDKNEVEKVRKNATQLINTLIEFGQRCEIDNLQRAKMSVLYKDKGKEKKAELFLTEPNFLLKENKVFRLDKNLEEVKRDELENALLQQKDKKTGKAEKKSLKILKKELGEFELVI